MAQGQSHHQPRSGGGGNAMPQFDPKWVSEAIDNDAIEFMEKFGLHLCAKQPGDNRPGFNAMTTAQIRNVFSEVKRIGARLENWEEEYPAFLMLRPKIAYNTARAVQRTRDSRMMDFKKVFDEAHGQVNDSETFRRFMMLLEGIIAYHKVAGGKD
ncbi:MAG: type III-A CRISPR-associated protein Csm2 [Saprospiraceae bacterium]|nr:type III-A CRISPR-associated protein Csm2 [Saprospiraceae bacterium]